MKKILNITDRLEDKKRRHQLQANRDRSESVKRAVQCTSCHFKCAMCGYHLNATETSCPSTPDSPEFTLCDNCLSEFKDFLDAVKGKEVTDIFWHNREWLNLWSAWLNYHQAIREFRDSNEFIKLTQESSD